MEESTFMHWEVQPEKLEPYIPEGLELDLFEGKAYVGVIPFQMKNATKIASRCSR